MRAFFVNPWCQQEDSGGGGGGGGGNGCVLISLDSRRTRLCRPASSLAEWTNESQA